MTRKTLIVLLGFCALGLGAGPANAQQVTVTPSNVNFTVGQTQQYTATVTGLSGNVVTWTISPTGAGSISASGLYTAPASINSQQTVTIKATSTVDVTKSGTASATLKPISITISPSSSNTALEHTQQFTATVTNSSAGNTWSVTPEGAGTISSGGLYTAPTLMPTPATAAVTATAVGDATKSAFVTVSFLAVSVSISPGSANVLYGGTRQFTATANNSGAGVTWAISPSNGGSISSTGLYTAPATASSPQQVTVTATSVADPTKSASSIVSFVPVTVSISPVSANLNANQTQQFSATATNSSAGVTWSISPSESGTISSSGLYTAPASIAAQQTVTVRATSVTDTSKSASSNVTLISSASVSVNPATATLGASQTRQFAATVVGLSGTTVTWSITPPGTGSIGSSGLYTAPAAVSATQSVTIRATSTVDTTKSGTATVTLQPISVTVAPTTATVYAGQTQQFSATVSNASDTAATWSISPAGTGSVSAAGLYTPPANIASQQTVTVTATSQQDSAKSASATVTLVPAVSVTVAPAAVNLYAGQTQQFTATVVNTANAAVTWSVAPAGAGTVSASGLYSAPATIAEQQTVTITATSQFDGTKSGTASVTLLLPVSVTVSPSTVSLGATQTQQFSSTVANSSNTAVTWTISPVGAGTVSTSGLYTAPATIAAQQIVTITATSQGDTTKSSSATITLMPVVVTVAPSSVTLNAGGTQTFAAMVSNSSNTTVSWSVSPAGAGAISAAGLYSAPATVTAQQTVTVTATSQADTTKAATATVTLSPPVSVTVAPQSATLYGGQTQQLTATVANSGNQVVSWTVSPAGSGSISATGRYTAPATISTQQTVTITATSQADTTKLGTATVTLSPPVTVTVAPQTAGLSAGQTQQFTTTVTNTTDPAVTWSVSPAGAGTISATGLYTAPATVASQQTVTVTATSQADSTKSSSATVTLSAHVSVTVAPPTVSLYAGQTQQFTATIANSINQAVTWTVAPAGTGTISATGLYTAPSNVTAQLSVTIMATSEADTTKSASATVTLLPPITVTVTPGAVSLSDGQTQQFTAAVANSSNTAVTWKITPAGVGTIDTNGRYTAPTSVAAQQSVTITATSQADPSKAGTAVATLVTFASVTVTPGSATLYGSQSQQVTVTVANTSDPTVTWSLSPAGVGTLDAAGLYTAPASITAQQTVTITATLQVDGSKTGSATVTLLPGPITVTVSPGSAVLSGGRTQLFTAAVTGTSTTAVTWSISPAAGAINSAGLYTAPAVISALQTVTITATSTADQTTTAVAVVTLTPPPVTVSLAPSSATLFGGQTRQFTAVVGNSGNTSVTWSVDPAGTGSIDANGLYTAPTGLTTAQSILIAATSAADPSVSNSVSITLDPSQLVSVAPNTGRAGDIVTVTITGQYSNFVQGSTQVNFGSGITAGPVQVTSPFTLVVSLTLNSAAIPGPRNLSVLTPAGSLTLAPAFTVTPGPPSITISAPVDLSFTNTSPVAVRGNVSDPSAAVSINGIVAQNAGGSFLASAVPLVEGNNELVVLATNSAGITGSTTVRITLDTTPPKVAITSPAPGLVTTASSVAVSGTVNDTVVGTVNSQQATVTVNGTPAAVSNRAFLAASVSLNAGMNVIQVVGTDRSGNSVTTSVTVTRVVQTQPEIRAISGSNQTGTVSSRLALPLVVQVVDAAGLPQAGKPVIFKVVQANGSVDGGAATVNRFVNGGVTQSVVVNSDSKGQATVNWTLGTRSGAGNNRVEATSAGFNGPAVFVATANSATPALISADAGSQQTGAVNSALAFPFVVVVSDAGHNRLANVPVTFSVVKGGGSLAGQSTVTQNTDGDGRALTVLTLGPQAGAATNMVTATFTGNHGQPVVFTASALSVGDPTQTRISGVVLDNANVPISGVTMRLYQPYLAQQSNIPAQVGAAVQTDAQGQFTLTGVPAGRFKLMADGGTAQRPGTWPTLEYDIVAVTGNNNTVGTPIYLLPLDLSHQVCVTATTGGVLTLPQVPGFSLSIQPGSVTFPGGAQSGCVSVTPVHLDKVPMVPAFGQQPRFVVTIQPVGALFNPPATITFPNVDSLKPREVTELFSFDHDLNAFVSIGTGTVSDDGQIVKSDPGIGILKAGWHMPGPPVPPGGGADATVTITPQAILLAPGETDTMTATGAPDPGDTPAYTWTSAATFSLAPGATSQTSPNVITVSGGSQPGVDTLLAQFRPQGNPAPAPVAQAVGNRYTCGLNISTIDPKFAPGADPLLVTYSTFPGSVPPALGQLYAKFEVYIAGTNTLIYQDNQLPLGNRVYIWDGKTNKGPNAGKYASPNDSPFFVQLSMSGKPDFSTGCKTNANTSVLIESITLGPAGAQSLVKDPLAGGVDKDVTATVKIQKKDGTGVITPSPVVIDWTFQDPPDTFGANPAGVGANDNCPVAMGGKRGLPSILWKLSAGGSVAADGQSAKSTTGTSGTTMGVAKVIFSASGIAGDNYILSAKAHKGPAELAHDDSGTWSIRRKVSVTNVYQMPSAINLAPVITLASVGPAFAGNGYTDYIPGGAPTAIPDTVYVAPIIDPPNAAETPAAGDSPAAIRAKAQAWFDRVGARVGPQLNAFEAANHIGAGSIISAQYLSPKDDGLAGTGITHFYPGVMITYGGQVFAADGKWPVTQGIENGARETKYVFKNSTGPGRPGLVVRHEVGHASDHHSFGDGSTFGGDHSDTQLMHPSGLTSVFSNNDILKLRGWRRPGH